MTPKLGGIVLICLGLQASPAWAVNSDDPAGLNQKAENGDVAAQLALGLTAEENEEKPDYATAAQWYLRASAGGSGEADWHLGMLYETGEGVPQSYEDARASYERAVARGIEAANMRLGLFYLEGWGVKPDRAKMLALITRAAESGYVPAMSMLSGIYFSGVGAPRDSARALQWAERAAQLDDREGQLIVGHLARRGAGLKRDMNLARDWYQLSAEQEYSAAMLAMAATFLQKGSTAEERASGKRWLELALEKGSAQAAFLLAVGELAPPEGLTPEAATRARGLLERSAALGQMEASEVLELEKAGRPLREALRHVATVPMEIRYVERSRRRVADTADAANGGPQVAKAVSPVYPASMRLAGQEGTVVLRFVVDTKGLVQYPEVVSASHPAFAESALQAVKQFRFEPGRKNGRAVHTRMQMPIYYNLKGSLGLPSQHRKQESTLEKTPTAN